MDDSLKRMLQVIANEIPFCEEQQESDISLTDLCDNSLDDAYEIGASDGEILLARKILRQFS